MEATKAWNNQYPRDIAKPAGTKNDVDSMRSVESLTIIPRARMGYESIAHEAEGRVGYWLRGYEGEWNNCFGKIQLVSQKNIETQFKARHQSFFTAKTLQI